jgi:hypothetical protein
VILASFLSSLFVSNQVRSAHAALVS